MRLETARLLIRTYCASDLSDFYAIFSDPEVMRYCDTPYTLAQCERWIDSFIRHPIALAVVEKQTNRVVGHALFKQMPGEEEGIYEIGWIYARAVWRRGYAYEASRALMEYGFATLHVHKIMAETIDPVRSVGLMEKLGMRREGVFHSHTRTPEGEWTDLYWYAKSHA